MKIAIFPAGENGENLHKILKKSKCITVCCFVDNNPNLIGTEIEGVKVVSPYRLKRMIESGNVDDVLVLSTRMISYGLEELVMQLDKIGIRHYKIVPSYILRKSLLNKEDYDRIFTPPEELNQLQHLQFHVADNCNLGCKRCQHFSNLVKESKFPIFSEVKKDFERLTELFENINVIVMLGGEPLLNPELDLYCNMTREKFPYAKIEIITNGLLIRKIPDKLIKSILDNDILVNVSYYPLLSMHIDQMVEFLLNKGIKYHISPKVEYFSKKITLKTNKKTQSIFKTCRDRCCTTLRDGKLYPCYLPATISYFNAEYGTKIDGNKSAIDIYDEKITGEKVLLRLKQEFDICKYCTEDRFYPWEIAKIQNMEDWIV